MRPFDSTCIVVATLLGLVSGTCPGAQVAEPAVLPPGVKAVWDLDKSQRETTPTRERISINGLWRWQPSADQAASVPPDGWGYFKVPGSWPGISDYMQKDCQSVFAHDSWSEVKLGAISAAWYQREIEIPAAWSGRRIVLSVDYLDSLAVVYVDGVKGGELRFPAGQLDLTFLVRPGSRHTLSMYVLAMPLEAVMMSFSDTATPRQAEGSVARRGLCGDVYLVSEPAAARIADVKIDTSVRHETISFGVALQDFDPDATYTLRAEIAQQGRPVATFTGEPFTGSALAGARATFTQQWKPAELWDIHTPAHQFQAVLTLLDAQGTPLDVSHPQTFGFREFWIDGRDFYLNGTRVFLSALPLDNAQVGAAWASYAGARESLRRLKSIGINFVYTHNYGCEPGTHLGFAEILQACDDVGMLVAFSQPHFGQYKWDAADADQENGYARHAAFYVAAAGNHPSVVMYSMSHNATGYAEDMNPDMIDGLPESGARDSWALNNVRRALRAEAIVQRLDPARIVYHHSSGNLSSMHTVNFYTNMAPSQELDDWFEHWATVGVKPFFTCEYMVPCTWDWTMYRGWYKGKREFGSAVVPWEFCNAEWSAQFLGDQAYRISREEEQNIRWEAEQFRAGRLWHRWDYPHQVGSRVFDAQHTIIGQYLTSNWRAFRTWGVSAISPWEHDFFWRLKPGVDRSRRQLTVDWDRLQRPGFSADYIDQRYERMDLAFEQSDWEPTADGQAILRNNQPLLAYIAGKPAAPTSKDHNFHPGERVEKQLIVINNSRTTVTCECQWELALPQAVTGRGTVEVATGQQQRVPLAGDLPADLPCGRYELRATFTFSTGERQEDVLAVDVLATPPELSSRAKVALFDPVGETGKLLADLGVACQPVDARADLSAYDVLIVGKRALTVELPAPDVSRVRDGLQVLVFEQAPQVLEQRLGFRIAEYGLRQVFCRVPDHPVLAGLDDEHLRDWRGAATLVPPRLEYEPSARYAGAPAVKWCNLEVSHVWRCGNRGNTASALIEKPARGDFLPILDGGYSLQYSPLLEYREGQGRVLFCQMDVTGRTEDDPAAARLARNILAYLLDTERPATTTRRALYVGDLAGRRHLELSGIALDAGSPAALTPERVLIVGRGGGQELANDAGAVADFVRAGGHVLALGLDQSEAHALISPQVRMQTAEHIATWFRPPAFGSALAGIAPADVHNRDPQSIPLVASLGAAADASHQVLGDGVLAQDGNVVYCQLLPYALTSGQGVDEQLNVRRTFRRTSCMLNRVLANLGVRGATPLLDHFATPLDQDQADAAGSVVRNGDFRQATDPQGVPDGWQVSADRAEATCTRDGVGPQGKPALRLTLEPGDEKASVMLSQLDVPVKQGQWYRISLRAKAEGSVGKSVSLALQSTRTWKSFIGYQPFSPGQEWKTFQFVLQSDGTAENQTRFQIWHANPGTLLLADIAMVPIAAPATQGRWSDGLYLDQPVEWDDPYRFFRW